MLLGGGAALALLGPGTARADLEAFMALSRRLTGQTDLDPEIGEIYLQALIQQYGVGAPLAGLEREIFTDWVTGTYRRGGVQKVATYPGALMWRAMNFTSPPGFCTGPDSWAEPPETAQ